MILSLIMTSLVNFDLVNYSEIHHIVGFSGKNHENLKTMQQSYF